MDLTGILNISGKAGLFKVISTGKKNIIVESLDDKKRIPLHKNLHANMLEEIGIYTYNETTPLKEVFEKIAKKENGRQTITHKTIEHELISYFRDIMKDYDEQRVYISNIRKVIQWYNSIQKAGLIKVEKKD